MGTSTAFQDLHLTNLVVDGILVARRRIVSEEGVFGNVIGSVEAKRITADILSVGTGIFDEINADQVIVNNLIVNNTVVQNAVQGPAFATDNALVRFDGVTGKIIKNSTVLLDDAGNLDTQGGGINTNGGTITTVGGNVNLGGGDAIVDTLFYTMLVGTLGPIVHGGPVSAVGQLPYINNLNTTLIGPTSVTVSPAVPGGNNLNTNSTIAHVNGNILTNGGDMDLRVAGVPTGDAYVDTLFYVTLNPPVVTGGAASTPGQIPLINDATTTSIIPNTAFPGIGLSVAGAIFSTNGIDIDTGTGNVTSTATISSNLMVLPNQGEIHFEDLAGGDYVGFKAPAVVTVPSFVWTLPDADGTAGQILTTDGAGNLSWLTATGSGPEFPDNTFRVYDDLDNTKKMAFEVANVSTLTTRTYTVPDFNGVLPGTSGTNLLLGNAYGPAFTVPFVASTSTDNVILGVNAGAALGSLGVGNPASSNVIVGADAASVGQVPNTSVIVGAEAGLNFGTSPAVGDQSTLIGYQAGNTATGHSVDGSFDFIGYQSGFNVTNAGGALTYVGSQAGFSSTSAKNNVYVGYQSGFNNTTGEDNTCFGSQSGVGAIATTYSQCTFIGSRAGIANNADDNTFVGYSAGAANIVGTRNVYVGYQVGLVATNSDNTLIGHQAGLALTVASGCTLIGQSAGAQLTVQSENVCIGHAALSAGTATNAVIISPLFSRPGQNFPNLTLIGALAAPKMTTSANGNNTLIGHSVAPELTSGQNNTFIGNNCGTANVLVTQTGSNNVFIGTGTGALTVGSPANPNNCIAIGTGALISGNNQMVIGGGAAPITQVFIGKGASDGNPNVSVTVQPSSVTNDGAHPNVPGSNLVLAAGRGTGGGALSSLIFQTPDTIGTAVNPQTLVTRMTITGVGTTQGSQTVFTNSRVELAIGTNIVLPVTGGPVSINLSSGTAADDIGYGGNTFNMSAPGPGTTTIDRIDITGWQAGSILIFVFSSGFIDFNPAAGTSGTFRGIRLNGSVTYSAAADDTLSLIYDGTVWQEIGRKVA